VRDLHPEAGGMSFAYALELDVRGRPVPQGALVRSPSGGLYHRSAKELEAWRSRIADTAQQAMGASGPLEGPVAVELTFRLERPAKHFLPANARRPVAELRLDAPAYPTGSPDADKLARSGLDALTAIAFRDDAQVARLIVTKRYCDAGEATGVLVRMRRMEATR
jgi:Holliday junction resolvase RusA-like endonuclease